MPVTIHDVCSGRGALMLCTGKVLGSEVFNAKLPLEKQTERVSQWRFAVLDHSEATSVDYSSSDIQHLLKQDKGFFAGMLADGFLIAIVSPQDHVFGISRMWQTMADQLHYEVLVARSREQADTWIRARMLQKFGLDVSAL